MAGCVVLYTRSLSGEPQGEPALLRDLHQDVVQRGDAVVGTFVDDGDLVGRGRNVAWNQMLNNLTAIDQVLVNCAGDLPGRKVTDLLAILSMFRQRSVSLRVHREAIDIADGSGAILDLIVAYRRAKRSQAIKAGQARARTLGKRIGRPQIPRRVRQRIRIALADGGGIRGTAKRFGVAPGSVVNIARRTKFMNTKADAATPREWPVTQT